ncbi:hypothetical protein B0I35DRAFT_473699 [Stachybotrys elegans]|uniref:BHLH domain-containing protein n=1 Tax=Stachybotrys elegans TaxID=80388 RepID=A0A8K0T6L7_9HYPO|nr:hypothetical protein B0I35DRAFT_473699 [Stachybotrys elegans]
MMSSSGWDGQDQHMVSTDDEFNQFLDMSGMANIGDGMHFDFNGFQDGSVSQMMDQPSHEPNDNVMASSAHSNIISRTDAVMPSQTAPSLPSTGVHPSMQNHMLPQADDISAIDAQIQYLQQQKLQQQRAASFFANQNHSVPPTPRSMEMTPNATQFYSQPEQLPHSGIFDPGYHQHIRDQHQQQEIFTTPFMSPAMTPLDTHFMDNPFASATSGTYFSPLTSPALVPKNNETFDHSTHSNNSPVEMDLELPATSVNSNIDLAKKARKSAAKARSKPGMKSSPISKPIRRKAGPSPAIVSQVISEMDESFALPADQSMLPLPAASTESSEENASVSPENLTDMPPPPIPNRRSMSRSPYIQAQTGGTAPLHVKEGSQEQRTPQALPQNAPPGQKSLSLSQQPHPATPASLMKLPHTKRTPTKAEDHMVTDHIESLELPESITKRPPAPINTQVAAAVTPSASSEAGSKSATFQPLPSPITKPLAPLSATASPQLLPGPSGPNSRKTPILASRNSRKRSTGSAHASPALLPKISPNIKPLLPGTSGLSAEDTASRLRLKSNYQNILEGNTVPGVSYPSELSTNLTSKRTSHKIAEQGRRNRINSALQIMAGLLPDAGKATSGDDADKKDAKGNTPNSKASVVESAIVHMKNLEQENTDLKQELQELKQQLEKLKAPST